jgi:hypothetical protein
MFFIAIFESLQKPNQPGKISDRGSAEIDSPLVLELRPLGIFPKGKEKRQLVQLPSNCGGRI